MFDLNKDKSIDFEEFVSGLSICTRGTTEERARCTYCFLGANSHVAPVVFGLYDLDGDGFIEKEELFTVLRAVHSLSLS